MSQVILQSINFSYRKDGNETALTDINVSFPDNSITAIIGKSGSGKSTLLKLLNGLLVPDSGTVQIFGQAIDYKAIYELRRKIGYVVQGPALLPHLTISENILLMPAILGTKPDQSRVTELMNRMKLPLEFRSRYPHQLSGGQQQRVALCRALYHKPPLLLMDESLSGLDVFTRREIQDVLLVHHQTEPITILFVTHDPSEARYLGEHILVLDQGRVVQFDKKEIVSKTPVNLFVDTLMRMA